MNILGLRQEKKAIAMFQKYIGCSKIIAESLYSECLKQSIWNKTTLAYEVQRVIQSQK